MKEINILKPIELTPEQKKELINLCNKTWPEYEFWWYAGSRNLGFTKKDHTTLIKGEHTYLFYWFEFVVRMAIDEELDEFMNFYLHVCSPKESIEIQDV